MRDRIEGAAHEMAKAWRDRLSSFKKQRQSYTPEQKHTMSELLDACNGNVSQALILLAGGQKNLTHKASWSFFTNSPHSGEKNAAMTTTVARGQY